jgi:hypothetical protein
VSCKYIALCASQDEELYITMCARPCEGDYCAQHQKRMDQIEQLDREMQQIVREHREKKK